MSLSLEKTTSLDIARSTTLVSDQNGADVESGRTTDLRLNPFGNPLLPSPTTDPLDPLNWANDRKYTIIGIVCFRYFMMISAVTAPIPVFVDLQAQFNASYTEINRTFALSNLGASSGPLFVSAAAEIIG